MADTPNSASTATLDFQQFFKCIPMECDHDDVFACLAALTGRPLREIRQLAIDKFGHPPHGPYWLAEESLITRMCAYYGLVATVYKEFYEFEGLPDVAILLIDYDESKEIGRHVVFHRVRSGPGPTQSVTEYIVDPAYWISPTKQIRRDVRTARDIQASWFIGIHQMAQIPGKKFQP